VFWLPCVSEEVEVQGAGVKIGVTVLFQDSLFTKTQAKSRPFYIDKTRHHIELLIDIKTSTEVHIF
jgi:hypothetical protein